MKIEEIFKEIFNREPDPNDKEDNARLHLIHNTIVVLYSKMYSGKSEAERINSTIQPINHNPITDALTNSIHKTL